MIIYKYFIIFLVGVKEKENFVMGTEKRKWMGEGVRQQIFLWGEDQDSYYTRIDRDRDKDKKNYFFVK